MPTNDRPPVIAITISQKFPVSTKGNIAKAQRPVRTAPAMKTPFLPCLSEYDENINCNGTIIADAINTAVNMSSLEISALETPYAKRKAIKM